MERLIRAISPQWALRREVARGQLDRLAGVQRLYQAATPSHMRSMPAPSGSGNAAMDHARMRLADWGRHLDENHDMTSGALTILSQMVATQRLVPMLKNRRGIHLEDQSLQLQEHWERWGAQADRTGMDHWNQLSMLMARTWFRDGEVFVVHFLGGEGHAGPVPYSVRAYEPDYVPFDMVDVRSQRRRVVHGVEIDQDGRPVGYHFYRQHPADSVDQLSFSDTMRLASGRVTHLRTSRRLGQYRGTSIIAPAVNRISDLFDYEQSEQFAAKVASAVCLQITRDPTFAVDDDFKDQLSGARPFEAQSGMVFNDLAPGEKVEVVDTSRPNPELGTHRKNMARAASVGMQISYSSFTHDYDGSYSSQRQDLVESRQAYRVPQDQWRCGALTPIYQRFVTALQLAEPGESMSFRGVDPRSLFDFDLIPPEVPWIQPLQEAKADTEVINNGTESRQGIMRKRGARPERVDRERSADGLQSETMADAFGETSDEESDDETQEQG